MFERLIEVFSLLGDCLDTSSRESGRGKVIPIALQTEAGSNVARRVLIEKSTEPYWKERGWTQLGRKYSGYYRTRFGNCEGQITVSAGGYCLILINAPPNAIRQHPKWVCFHHVKARWYRVHTVIECRDVSSAIFEIENIITESYAQYS